MKAPKSENGFPGSEGVPDGVFHAAYRRRPALWRTGRPQPAVLEALERGWFSADTMLDAGCGSGENTIAIARLRPDVRIVARDLVPEAISLARIKSRIAGVEARIEFGVGDLREGVSGPTFDEALDAGVLHLFSDADRLPYLRTIRNALRIGGRFTVIVFRDEETRPGGPRRMARDELEDLLARSGFVVETIDKTIYETDAHEGGARSWLVRARGV